MRNQHFTCPVNSGELAFKGGGAGYSAIHPLTDCSPAGLAGLTQW